MDKENNFSKVIDKLKEQTEIPVFPETRVNVFYSDYVDSLDEASDVLEEKFQSEENDNDILNPFDKDSRY